MFQTTFTLGQYPMDWLEEGINLLGGFITSSMEDGPLKSMLVDGIIGVLEPLLFSCHKFLFCIHLFRLWKTVDTWQGLHLSWT